jgi:hypothetical protein
MRRIAAGPSAVIGDFRRYPGCVLLLSCGACGWTKPYNAERILARLLELKNGGHTTRLDQVARRVAWPCPGCGRLHWKTGFAYPPHIDAAEVRRQAARWRN